MFGGIACLTLIPGQADLPRQHVRVRGDAVVHDRPPVGDPAADHRSRPGAPLPRARDAARGGSRRCRCSRCSEGWGPGSAFVTVTALHVDVAAAGVGWLLIGVCVYIVYRRRQGLDLVTHDQGRGPAPRDRDRGRVRVRARRVRRARLRARGDGDRGADGGAPASRDPRAGHDLGAVEQPDRRAAAQAGGARPVDHRGGQGAGRASRLRSLGQGAGRSDRTADRRRGQGDARRGDRDADVPRRGRASAGRSRPCCASGRAA